MTREGLAKKRERALKIGEILIQTYPGTRTFLHHQNPFELLCATVLSAQCTDERVNQVTPGLFSQFPTPHSMAESTPDLVVVPIRPISFCYTKATHLVELSKLLIQNHNGQVPPDLNELIKLPGVGRKTANVVLGQAFNQPGITVDTHVKRLSQRLGFTKHNNPVKIEEDLSKVWQKIVWTEYSSVLILHGRNRCMARSPQCEKCEIQTLCPSQKH
jgi:endonuclease-3